jgi:uncharacterized protein (DUF1501 family)
MITTTRRTLLAGLPLGLAALSLPGISLASANTPKRFVFILQRGAADGLAIVPPVGDPALRAARGALIPEGALPLTGIFALHPAMAQFRARFAANQASIVHAVATVYRERSHFDAQNLLEAGSARPYGRQDGWMNRLIGLLPVSDRSALAVAPAIPLALRGSAPVSSYAPTRLPQANDDLVARVSAMYANDQQLHGMWEEALRTRGTVGDLSGNNGQNGAQLGQLAARLLAAEDGARIAFLETGGWDTHSGQQGRLNAQLRGLDALIEALRTGLGAAWTDTLVIVATEFGRTVAVNGTGGSDHGTASALLMAGGAPWQAGRVVADWPGLSESQRHEGRDLKPTASLEATIATALAHHYALDAATVRRTLFPELTA